MYVSIIRLYWCDSGEWWYLLKTLLMCLWQVRHYWLKMSGKTNHVMNANKNPDGIIPYRKSHWGSNWEVEKQESSCPTSYIQSRRDLLLPYLRKTTPDIWRMVTFFAAQFYKNSGWTFLGSLLLNGEAGFNGDLKQFSKCFKLQGGLCQT